MRQEKAIVFGVVKDGKMNFKDTMLYSQFIKQLPDCNVEIKLRRQRNSRSEQQNAYYWGVVISMMAYKYGDTPMNIHEQMKYEFLLDRTGTRPMVKSTTDLNTVEMEDYLQKVRDLASMEMELYIPLPNEKDWLDVK